MSLGNDNELQRQIVADFAAWPRWKQRTFWFMMFLPWALFYAAFVYFELIR